MCEKFDGIVPLTPTDYITQQHIMRYKFASSFVTGKAVLDSACGAGYGSEYLSRSGASIVLGVDVSEAAVTCARTHYSRDNLYFLQGDVVLLPFEDDFFDVVVSFETIEHIKNYRGYVEEMKRVLNPDGIFVCSTPNIQYTHHPYYHVKEFHLEEFFQLLNQYFKNVGEYGQFITAGRRVRDVLRLREKSYAVARAVLSVCPVRENIKKVKRKVRPPSVHVPVYEIGNEEFEKHKVKPLCCKDRTELVRIMVAVCREKKVKAEKEKASYEVRSCV